MRVKRSESFPKLVAVHHYRFRERTGDSTGKLAVQPKLIEAGVERTVRLGGEPSSPVRMLLADLFDFRTAPPARAVIVPSDLGFGDMSERAARDPFLAAIWYGSLRCWVPFCTTRWRARTAWLSFRTATTDASSRLRLPTSTWPN